jgi:alkaline phosphatase D
MRQISAVLTLTVVASLTWATAPHAVAQTVPAITHGVASGDVTPNSAVVWSRFDREATMNVRVTEVTGSGQTPTISASTPSATDFTAQTKIEGLTPNTRYLYEIRFETAVGESSPVSGTFRAAPDPDTSSPVSLIWAGDLARQGYCRRAGRGYEFFDHMTNFGPNLFVANGDMIYADSACQVDGPIDGWINVLGDFSSISSPDVDWDNTAQVAEIYRAHWRYNRTDPAFQDFLGSTPMVVQWDDHEVINDFGAVAGLRALGHPCGIPEHRRGRSSISVRLPSD